MTASKLANELESAQLRTNQRGNFNSMFSAQELQGM